MPLTLHIRPEGGHHYLARVFDGKQLVGTPTVHARVEDAIAAYGGEQKDLPHATTFDLWYGGWSVGEVTAAEMRAGSKGLAERLTMLSAVLR